jgi:hypothetical protein
MAGGRTSWEPTGAVVFIGAAAGGGPSADCCCDYLNFFTDLATAQAWTAGHPHLSGQILDQAEAEDLAARLFGTCSPSADRHRHSTEPAARHAHPMED